MKDITSYFVKKDLIFKKFERVEPKELGSRKKIEIYYALGIDKNYYAIFKLEAKSRFLKKNAEELITLLGKLIDLKDHNFKKKYLLISSPLCSKARTFLKDNGFKVDNKI